VLVGGVEEFPLGKMKEVDVKEDLKVLLVRVGAAGCSVRWLFLGFLLQTINRTYTNERAS
jgi:hypothetical protein